MARYGSWEDRPRESGQEWERDRWRRELEERRGGREDERSQDWGRDEPRYGGGEYGSPRRSSGYGEGGAYGGAAYGGSYGGYGGYGAYRGSGERWGGYGGTDERWGTYGGGREYRPHREHRPEVDPPWVERGPRSRWAREDSRGLVEWEDRGPLKWLGDKLRDKPARGPKGYTRSDERIHDDVCERIARSGVDADEVEVKVEKREVTLSGTVRSREDKWRLEEVADDVFGVEDVHNQLRVSRTGESDRDTGAMEGRLRH